MLELFIALIIFFAGMIFGTYMENKFQSKREIPNLKVFDLKENEILVLSYPNELTENKFTQLKHFLENNLPEKLKGKIVMMDNGAELTKEIK